MTDYFDAESELASLRKISELRRRHDFGRSRLNRYEGELLRLRNNLGATVAELQNYLAKKGVKVAHSTVSRWLKNYG